MLPAAGACAAVLAGASHAWAASPVATPTTPAGATTTSTLTWDVAPNTGSVTCQLSWDDGSGFAPVSGTSCPFTNNPADPNQVAYPATVWGHHAGRYELTVSVPSGGSVTSTPATDVVPVTPTLTGPAGPSNNRTPSWTIANIDPEGTVTCSATSPQLASVSCTPTRSTLTTGTVSLDLSTAPNDATIAVTATVTAHGESSSATTSYALDVTAPTPATLKPAAASGTGRTPAFAVSNVESGATVACTLTDQNNSAVSSLISACDSTHAALDLTGAPDSVYTLAVTLTDTAGNSSTNTATYTLLPPAPVVTAPTSPARDDHPTFTVAESDSSVTLTCTLTGLAGAVLASPCTTGDLVGDLSGATTDGTVRLTVTVTDAAGLTNSGSDSYTVDRQVDAPTLTLASSSGTAHRVVVSASDPAPDLASLRCAVTDAGGATVVAPTPCASSTTIDLPATALDGDYTVTATATDAVGNTASTSTTYTVLQVAPAIAPLPAPSTTRTVPFSITTGADVVSITCSVVGPSGPVSNDTGCTTPSSFAIPSTGLDGAYVLTVTVTDSLNHQASDSATYTLLQSDPVLDPLSAPSTDRSVTFTFDPGADVASVLCSLTGPGGLAWSDSGCVSPSTFVIPATGRDGVYTLTVAVTDSVGHTASTSATYTLLQSDPVLDPLPAPSTDRSVTFTFDPGADVASVLCSLTGPGGLAWSDSGCVSPSTFVIPATGRDGVYTLTVAVTDSVGHTATAAATYTLLPTAPYVTGPAPATTSNRKPSWTIGDDVVDLVRYECTSSVPVLSCTSTVQLDLTGLADGTYSVSVVAVDSTGATSAPLLLSVTLIPPAPYATVPASSPSSTRTPQWTIADKVVDLAGYDCVSGVTVLSCGSTVKLDLNGLPDGTYSVTVRAVDSHGVAGDPTTFGITLIAPPPYVVTPPATPSSAAQPQWAIADDVADFDHYTCASGVPVLSCTSTVQLDLTGQPGGDYSVTVEAVDSLGVAGDPTTLWFTRIASAPYVVTPPVSPASTLQPAWAIADDISNLDHYTCTTTLVVLSCGSTVQVDLTGLADGTYSVVVQAVDTAGNAGDPLTVSFTLIPPAPRVVTPPVSPASTRKPAWTITDGVVHLDHYSCTSSVPVLSCTSTVQLDLTGLADGTYSVTVQAVDSLGAAGDPVTLSFTLIPPAPSVVTAPVSPASTLKPSWTVADGVVDFDHFTCTSSVRILSCSSTVQLDLTGLVDGTYSVTVRAVDSLAVAGDPTTLSFTLIPPAPRVVTPPTSPASTPKPSWTITDDVVDLSRYTCTSTVTVLRCGPTVQLDLTGLVDGTYTVTVRAVDSLGVAGDPTTLSFTLVPPAPFVVAAPTSPASGRFPQWTFGDGALDASGYACSATGPGGVGATAICSVGSPYVSLDLTGLVDGLYTLTVRAIDAQGRAGDPFSVQYSLIPPAPVATASPASPSSTRTPQWTLTDGAVDLDHYTCTSRVAVLQCGSTVQLGLTGRVDGTYTVTVRAVDSLGAAGDPVTLSFTMLPPAPSVVTSPVSPASTLKPAWTITDSVADLARYTCTSTVPVLSCGPTVQIGLNGLVDGTYTVTVQAVDSLGQAGDPVVLSFTLVPPAPVAVSSPVSPSAVRQPAWSLTDAAVGPVDYDCSATGPGGITAPVSCGSSATVVLDTTGLPDGTYTVVVRAVDSLGAAGDATTFTYLLVPPPPTVSSAPASPWNSRSPQWTVTDAVGGVTYLCTVTGPSATPVSCAGDSVTLNLAGAADGTYFVSLLAVDSLGHSSDPAAPLRVSYLLDTAAPAAPAVAVTPSPSQGRTATYTISGVEPSGTVTCAFSAPAASTVAVPTSCGTGATINLTGQPDGSYVLRVTVTDVAGNTSAVTTATYVLDTTAPAAPIATIASPGNDVTPTPTLVVEPGVTLTCTVQRYFVTVAADVPCGTDGTVDLTGFVDGEFEISLWATDVAGNVGPASTYVYVLDTVPPATPLVAEPATPSPIVDPTWLWTPEIDTTAACTLTARDGSAIAGPSPCDGTFTADLSARPDGTYTFTLVVSDPAGNHATVTSVYLLDRTAPVPPTVVPPASPSSSMLPRWTITSPRGATLTCTLMRGRTVILGPGTCPAGGVVSLAGQPDGTYTLRVTATDSAGNVSAPSITSYILDTQPPASPTLVYGSPSSGTDRSPYWGFTLPSGTTGRCELWYGGNLVSARNDCHGSVSFTLNGADGHYTIRIYALDAAGNVSAPATAGYDLFGHGGGVGGGSTSGGTPTKRHRPTPPPTTVQRLLDTLNAVTGQTAKKVRQAAGTVTSVLPTLPIVHDPLTTNVSHAVQNAINAVSRAGGGTGFPLLLLVIVALFLMAQSRIDRRDPKLAFASVAAEDNLAFRPPPSRGDAR